MVPPLLPRTPLPKHVRQLPRVSTVQFAHATPPFPVPLHFTHTVLNGTMANFVHPFMLSLNVTLIKTSDFSNPLTAFSRSYFSLFNGSDRQ